MTISSTDDPRAGPFNGNGSQTVFPFVFKTFASADLLVVRTDADGLEYVLVLDSDYSVSLNANQDTNPGGSVTYPISGAALPAGETLTIASNLDFIQTTDIQNAGGFFAQVIEDALDRNVMLIKQVNEEVGRSLRLSLSTPVGVDPLLPVPDAQKIIGWNDTATGLVNRDITDFSTVIAFASWQSQTFNGDGVTAAFALSSDPGNINNMDVSVSGVTQTPGIDFLLSGTTLTFTAAPAAGTNNILARYGQALPQGTAALQSDLANTTTAGLGDAMIGHGTITSIASGVLTRHATLDAAVTAIGATNATLTIRGPITVASNVTIPSTLAVEVVKPGFITINAGVTLTISGHFSAGAYAIFGGAGSVAFTASSRSVSPKIWFATGDNGAAFNTRRTLVQNLSDPGGSVHAYEDDNTLNFTYAKAANFNAYASFDANTTISGAGAYDHSVAFQARQTYSGSNEIWNRWDGFNWLVTHSGTGTVATCRGFNAENPLGSGPITFLAGFLCQELTRGTENHGFYSATALNTVRTGSGQVAQWRLQGNGLTGGFGLVLMSSSDSTARVLQTANFALRLGTNNTDTLYGTADGRWKMYGPGTVATDALTSAQTLEVIGAGGATLKATGGAGNGALLAWNHAAAGDNLLIGFYTETAATQRGSIDYNRTGGLTRYNTTSDATLKNVLGDAPAAKSIEILESTRLREYAWKEDPTQKPQIGVIAQELHETFKGAVSVGGGYEEEVDGQKVTKYRPWGVDKTAFVFHLIAGFQHQQKLIAALEARIAALEDASHR